MANYLQIFDFRVNQDLKKRVVVSITIAARNVLAEDSQTANHENRLAWAKRAITSPETEADRMIWAVLANPTIQSDPVNASDGDFQFEINSQVNNFANI